MPRNAQPHFSTKSAQPSSVGLERDPALLQGRGRPETTDRDREVTSCQGAGNPDLPMAKLRLCRLTPLPLRAHAARGALLLTAAAAAGGGRPSEDGSWRLIDLLLYE